MDKQPHKKPRGRPSAKRKQDEGHSSEQPCLTDSQHESASSFLAGYNNAIGSVRELEARIASQAVLIEALRAELADARRVARVDLIAFAVVGLFVVVGLCLV